MIQSLLFLIALQFSTPPTGPALYGSGGGGGGGSADACELLGEADCDMDGAFWAAPGAQATPSYSFGADPNTGIYNFSDGRMMFVSNGNFKLFLTESSLYSYTPIGAPTGSESGPSLGFPTANSGFYYDAIDGNGVAVSVSSTRRAVFRATETQLYNTLMVPNGGAGGPSITFSSDVDNGFYRVASDVIGYTKAISGPTELASSVAALTAWEKSPVVDTRLSSTNTPTCSVEADLGKSYTKINPIGHGSTAPYTLKCECVAAQASSGTTLLIGWIISRLTSAGVWQTAPSVGAANTCDDS